MNPAFWPENPFHVQEKLKSSLQSLRNRGPPLNVIPGSEQGEITSHNTPGCFLHTLFTELSLKSSRQLLETSVGFYRNSVPCTDLFPCLPYPLPSVVLFFPPLIGGLHTPSGSPICRHIHYLDLDNHGPWSHGAPEDSGRGGWA